MSYGGGFSTDFGANGFFDIRHVNLFGNLWQGGARVKVSQRQQLVQFDFFNPRFLRDGSKTVSRRSRSRALSARFDRDAVLSARRSIKARSASSSASTRTAIRSTNSARDAGDPTINRFAVSTETNRTISRKARSIFFLRYRFEDVRLFKIESLLIKDLLRPDSRTRISGFGVTFVRDTRRNCLIKYSMLELIAKGDPPDQCKYSATDPTNGHYMTADYNVSLARAGCEYRLSKVSDERELLLHDSRVLQNTTLAARGILGVGGVFSGGDRFTKPSSRR